MNGNVRVLLSKLPLKKTPFKARNVGSLSSVSPYCQESRLSRPLSPRLSFGLSFGRDFPVSAPRSANAGPDGRGADYRAADGRSIDQSTALGYEVC